MVTYTITENHFTSEDEAMAEVAGLGWTPIAVDRSPEDEELHWHDFDAIVFVVDGKIRVRREDGSILECGPGTRIEAPAGVVHADVSGSDHRVVFGFSVDPKDFTQPLNKPLSALPH